MEMKDSASYNQGVPPPYSGPQPNPQVDGTQPVIIGTTASYPAATTVSAVVVGNQMSPSPAVYLCRSCNSQVITRLERKPSMKTHLFALLLCVFGCWPCACVPYCVDSCNNADHYCPNCNSYIGSYLG